MTSQEQQYYQDQLIAYFRSIPKFRKVSDQRIQGLVSQIEINLLDLLKSQYKFNGISVYEFLDKDALKVLKIDTNSGGKIAHLNAQSDGKIREAIDFYLGFLDSKKHPLAEQEIKRRKKNSSKETKPTSKGGSLKQNKTTEVSEPDPYDKLEGKKHEETVTRYERDRGNRKTCIAHYGYVCQVCGMNFEQTYGDIGKDYIEVHHLHPVAKGERKVNPVEDLIPLCSNCHSMIHRQEDVSDWKGLREKYIASKNNNKNGQ